VSRPRCRSLLRCPQRPRSSDHDESFRGKRRREEHPRAQGLLYGRAPRGGSPTAPGARPTRNRPPARPPPEPSSISAVSSWNHRAQSLRPTSTNTTRSKPLQPSPSHVNKEPASASFYTVSGTLPPFEQPVWGSCRQVPVRAALSQPAGPLKMPNHHAMSALNAVRLRGKSPPVMKALTPSSATTSKRLS
jgi:hypothetical protein